MATIVIAEDEYLLAIDMAESLEGDGHEVLMAPDGSLALNLVRERRPQLVITDFMMPVMTGLELAKAIHVEYPEAGIPIVLVSGAHFELARKHSEYFAEIICKPCSKRLLLEAVARLLAEVRPSSTF